jgi:hypothetical protein
LTTTRKYDKDKFKVENMHSQSGSGFAATDFALAEAVLDHSDATCPFLHLVAHCQVLVDDSPSFLPFLNDPTSVFLSQLG